jgi:hypothetical protein
VISYDERLRIVPGPSFEPSLLRQHPPHVLRLCLDFAHDERHQRLDVLLGRRLPFLLHRVHRLGVHLGRDYGPCRCERRRA